MRLGGLAHVEGGNGGGRESGGGGGVCGWGESVWQDLFSWWSVYKQWGRVGVHQASKFFN